ncbi:QueD-like 6-pyruvoyl-tetrahydropterin synthase [Vibrio phage PWH3a-P1]|uniref:QueD-like 6-pyruvoyl-tetrahydropterin synthase n=1 Tax=Vibrio phage PWH3a-P1 TaxID=754058 RepID=UPI0002C07D71|nr:QueD-like 6-pyruvoyl-tetrahydropterin synthase [Vibrio phage PWH3a-P1]AGH31939.1 hypothetical protein VPIG_00081 [Vibrio phage PWH3a-P1]
MTKQSFTITHRICMGHDYTFTFYCNVVESSDNIELITQSTSKLCRWLDENWNGKLMFWEEDKFIPSTLSENELTIVPFQPTLENIGKYLAEEIVLPEGVSLTRVFVEETRKCSYVNQEDIRRFDEC